MQLRPRLLPDPLASSFIIHQLCFSIPSPGSTGTAALHCRSHRHRHHPTTHSEPTHDPAPRCATPQPRLCSAPNPILRPAPAPPRLRSIPSRTSSIVAWVVPLGSQPHPARIPLPHLPISHPTWILLRHLDPAPLGSHPASATRIPSHFNRLGSHPASRHIVSHISGICQ